MLKQTQEVKHPDVQSILLTKEQIHERVCEMAAQISRDYEGKNLLLVGVLRGAVVFFSDLMRELSIPCEIDFISASSYGMSAASSGKVAIKTHMQLPPKGKDLLLVEDILDTGTTLFNLKPFLMKHGANNVRIAALLDKPERRKVPIALDYCGFSVPNEFLVGYGLDYAERYRTLPYIGILKPEIYQK